MQAVLKNPADEAAVERFPTALDEYAAGNTTSLYAGVATFPMLPDDLSSDATSLLAGVDRLAVVTDMTIAPDGTTSPPSSRPAALPTSTVDRATRPSSLGLDE